MWYRKNLPGWERMLRLVAALGMTLCAWSFRDGPGGVVFGLAALVTTATSVFGYCPMCAIGGRRLEGRRDPS